MTSPGATPAQLRAGAGAGASLVAIFVASLVLRPQQLASGPLLPLIRDDLDIPYAIAGLLPTIPVICQGLFALLAPALGGFLGIRHGVTACLAVVAVFGVVRALAPDAWVLLALTIPLSIGLGLQGALLPAAVKERFRDRPSFATGVMTNGMQLGAAVAGAIVVPIAIASGTWRVALLAISLPAAAVFVLWIWLTRGPASAVTTRPRMIRPPIRNGVIWALILVFGLRSIYFQGMVAWLPTIQVDRGWDPSHAGALIAVLLLSSMPVTMVTTSVADRWGSRRTYITGASLTLLGATLGLLVVPAAVLLWVVVIGAAIGVLFPMTLTLPLDVTDRPSDVGAAVGMVLGVGYLLGAVGPFALGAARDASGSFESGLIALAVVAALLALVSLVLTPARLAASRARTFAGEEARHR